MLFRSLSCLSIDSPQILASIVFLVSGLIAGIYHRQMAMKAHERTCHGTKTCLESRIKLECEREQQEQLLLSVIPAYIAAEVSIAPFLKFNFKRLPISTLAEFDFDVNRGRGRVWSSRAAFPVFLAQF